MSKTKIAAMSAAVVVLGVGGYLVWAFKMAGRAVTTDRDTVR